MLKKFTNDKNGNFAMMAAVSMVPIMLAVGLGIDYSGAGKQRDEMQRALDSAALSIARKGDAINDGEARKIAINFLGSNFKESFSTLKMVRDGTNVELGALTPYKLNFGSLFGKKTVDIQVLSSADIGRNTSEIALVLDTTGSMAGGKLTMLKDAVDEMITTMEAQQTQKDSLKFALVPFSTFVNVGPQFGPTFDASGKMMSSGANWLDTLGRNPASKVDLPRGMSRFYAYDFLESKWPGCVETRPAVGSDKYDVMDIATNLKDSASLFVPSFDSDEPDDARKYPNSYLKDGTAAAGQGTAIQRAARYGIFSYTGPDGIDLFGDGFKVPLLIWNWPGWMASWATPVQDNSISTFYSNYRVSKGPDFSCSSQPMVALTDKFDDVRKAVDNLEAAGSTNIFEGMMWGWRVLSSRAPFAEGRKENTVRNNKVMILLTDGFNNMGNIANDLGSAYSSFGYLVEDRLAPMGSSRNVTTKAMDVKTLEGCTNAKADGIEIYTILLETDENATEDMLRKCASDDAHFFNLPSRDQLKETFQKINDKIVTVRLTG
jgi:Flp pilus assembly protein TadG